MDSNLGWKMAQARWVELDYLVSMLRGSMELSGSKMNQVTALKAAVIYADGLAGLLRLRLAELTDVAIPDR